MRENLYTVLCALFCICLVVSNFMTPKLCLLNNTLLPAGLITYPVTFFICDFVTEIYGKERARFMVYLGFFMTLFACLIVQSILQLPAYDQVTQSAYSTVFGASAVVFLASLTAYGVAQLCDVQIYAFIKHMTGGKWLALRCLGAILIAQLIDTSIATGITFTWGFQLNNQLILHLIIVSYMYKALFAVACTPLYYYFVTKAQKPCASL